MKEKLLQMVRGDKKSRDYAYLILQNETSELSEADKKLLIIYLKDKQRNACFDGTAEYLQINEAIRSLMHSDS